MEFNCLVDILTHLWVVFFRFDACKFLYACEFDFSSARLDYQTLIRTFYSVKLWLVESEGVTNFLLVVLVISNAGISFGISESFLSVLGGSE